MRWGVRKSQNAKATNTTKPKKTPEQKAAFRKKLLIGAAGVAAVLGAAAVAYGTYDIHKTNQLSGIARVGEINFKNIRDKSPGSDRIIEKGTEFARRSFLKKAAWPNDIRTYAVQGKDSDLIKRYGDNLFGFKLKETSKIGGLDTQLNLIGKNSKDIKATLKKELAGKSLSGKKLIDKMSEENLGKFTIEYLRRTAWDGGEASSPTAKLLSTVLQADGYVAVNDLNLPGSAARVLLDRSAFMQY